MPGKLLKKPAKASELPLTAKTSEPLNLKLFVLQDSNPNTPAAEESAARKGEAGKESRSDHNLEDDHAAKGVEAEENSRGATEKGGVPTLLPEADAHVEKKKSRRRKKTPLQGRIVASSEDACEEAPRSEIVGQDYTSKGAKAERTAAPKGVRVQEQSNCLEGTKQEKASLKLFVLQDSNPNPKGGVPAETSDAGTLAEKRKRKTRKKPLKEESAVPLAPLRLHEAALKGHVRMVERLIAASANIDELDEVGDAPLHIAAENGHSKVVDRLIAAKCNIYQPTSVGATSLHLAAMSGHGEVVERLIAADSSCNIMIDQPTPVGATSLHIAATSGYGEVVDVLIAARCNIDLPRSVGDTALHIAAMSGHQGVVERLIAAKCNVDQQTPVGATSLHLAAMYGHRGVVERLIAARCAIDQLTQDAWTPLSVAVFKGHGEVVDRLIEAKCDVNARTPQGGSVVAYAESLGHRFIAEALRSAGGRRDWWEEVQWIYIY